MIQRKNSMFLRVLREFYIETKKIDRFRFIDKKSNDKNFIIAKFRFVKKSYVNFLFENIYSLIFLLKIDRLLHLFNKTTNACDF